MNKQEIIDQLSAKHQLFADFVSGLSEADFSASKNGKWTAGQQVDHIQRGVSAVRSALAIPKFVPNLIYGSADRPSRNYDELVQIYLRKLAAGGKASGRFIPKAIWFSHRTDLIRNLMTTVVALSKRVEKQTEDDLDKYLLPHPILGKLTFREMLLFTIYHVEHHHKNAISNLSNL